MGNRNGRNGAGRPQRPAILATALLACLAFAWAAWADVPGRNNPAGTSVPLPGTQQQELGNITFPAPFNVFEFTVTCVACHGGTVDQQASHGGNWAGTSMAGATRDPVFRANVNIANESVRMLTGQDGAGSYCFRCHSPNGWYSGRFDPLLGGSADGRDAIHSIVLSTDDEGVQCEMCHRTIGGVTMRPSATDPTGTPLYNPLDNAWNMLAGILDWPHLGRAYPEGPADGAPFGNGALQINDLMSYGGKYTGSVEPFFSDVQSYLDPTGIPWPPPPPGGYTGQSYGVYPWFYVGFKIPPPPGMPKWNVNGEEIVYNADGSTAIQLEVPVPPDQRWSALSPEHGTWRGDFIRTSEFCGACHNMTLPFLNHGLPAQRTYTEWKLSHYGNPAAIRPDNVTPYFSRCQDCHMPTLMHEYSDAAPVSLNPDPALAGWYPYSKDRNMDGGTTFHKLAGANRDLPMMMKVLYPEVDLEVVGAPTGRDTRIFPGMQSDRAFTWDRNRRNTEFMLRDAASVRIAGPPVQVGTDGAGRGIWRVVARVTNLSGHRIPSGFPDGRRLWLRLEVKDSLGNTVYESGYYDPATATLSNDRSTTVLTRARGPAIGGGGNAVMIYERRTGSANRDGLGVPDGTYAMSVDLLNGQVLFDNRLPPAGFRYLPYRAEGVKFWTYTGTESAAVPVEEFSLVSGQSTRYPDGQNWDDVTYTFTAPAGAVLKARAELYYESHTRELMERLKDADASTVRPEGPPDILDPNYPLTPTYLSDSIFRTTGVAFSSLRDLDGNPLLDNWGGIAYGAWLLTGKGTPFRVAEDDTAVAAPPAAPDNVTALSPFDPATGLNDPFGILLRWNPVAGAEKYLVWIRYGLSDLTASWDRLALVDAPQTAFFNEGLNVGKSYAYKVQAINAKGAGPESAVVIHGTPTDLPFEPLNLRVIGVTDTTVSLSWFDQADNETGFIIERQDVPNDPVAPLPPYVEVARIPTPDTAGWGGVNHTDTGLLPGRVYNYRVLAFNANGPSVPSIPVSATTLALPAAPTALSTLVVGPYRVDLSWADNSGNETGFRIQRSIDGLNFATIGTTGLNATAFSDNAALPGMTYHYRVFSFYSTPGGGAMVSLPSNTATAATPAIRFVTLAATPASPQLPGATVRFTAAATGFGVPVEYEFSGRLGNGTFGIARAYNTNGEWSWPTTGKTPGTYEIRVNVRRAGSTVVEATATIPYLLGLTSTAPTGVTLTPGLPSPQPKGTTIDFLAAAVGGTGPFEYQFQGRLSGGTFGTARPYGQDPLWRWPTGGAAAGSYEIRVNARRAGSTAAAEATTTILYVIGPAGSLPTGVTLTPSLPSPQAKGAAIEFTAAAAGGTGPYEYQFLGTISGGTFRVAQPYSQDATWSWPTAGVAPGTYQVRVDARRSGSAAAAEATTTISFVVLPVSAPPTGVTLTPSLPSPLLKGPTVEFLAGATGGTGPYEYQFLGTISGGTLRIAQPYSQDPTWSWPTAGVASGTYEIRINARQAGSAAPFEATATIAYVVQ